MGYLSKFFLLFILAHTFAMSQDIENFINGYTKEHNFNGTILIQSNDTIVYHKSFGLAERQFNIPTNNQTKYKIASVTKLFTSVLVMQLYEEGKIDLDKSIKTYLPGYTGEGAEKVTIHQLLNHTSGMVNIDTITSQESAIRNGIPIYQKPYTTDEILTKYCSDKLINEPGKVFSYNNAEYIILGKIIETIYGKSFEQVLKQQILLPLKMDDSGLLFQYNIIENLADTYFTRDDLQLLVNDLPVYIENFYASGAMYSTAEDLLKFSKALFGLKLLKKETLDLMLKPGLDNYGYGVWADEIYIDQKKYRTIKRPGSIMGANAMLFHFLNENFTIIILSNTNTTNLDEFVIEISKRFIK